MFFQEVLQACARPHFDAHRLPVFVLEARDVLEVNLLFHKDFGDFLFDAYRLQKRGQVIGVFLHRGFAPGFPHRLQMPADVLHEVLLEGVAQAAKDE